MPWSKLYLRSISVQRYQSGIIMLLNPGDLVCSSPLILRKADEVNLAYDLTMFGGCTCCYWGFCSPIHVLTDRPDRPVAGRTRDNNILQHVVTSLSCVEY